jgi:hypothetical protein
MHPISSAIADSRFRNSLAGTRVSVIRTATDLRLLQLPRDARRRLYILLEVAGVPAAQSLRWESRLNSQFRECGCSMGACFSFAAVLASLTWQVVHRALALSHWPAFLLRTVVLVFVAGGLGKLLGLGVAELEIRHIASRLIKIVGNSPQGECDHVDLYKVGG